MKSRDNILKEEESVNVSGSKGKRWSGVEEEKLFEIAPTYITKFGEGYKWEEIARELNKYFKNNRTAKACEDRWRAYGGDDRDFIE